MTKATGEQGGCPGGDIAALLAAPADVDTAAALAEAYPDIHRLGDPLADPVGRRLEEFLVHPSEDARVLAIEALGSVPDVHGSSLAARYERESSPSVRMEIVRVLAVSHDLLERALTRDRDAAVRRFAAQLARAWSSPADTGWIERARVAESDPEVLGEIDETLRTLAATRRR